MPREERGKRMQTYQEFLKEIDLVRSGSSDRVSEIDLSNPKDLRAVMTGIVNAIDPQALTIHFGASDFTGKYRMVVENFAQWQASNGRVHSIDLQYAKQVGAQPGYQHRFRDKNEIAAKAGAVLAKKDKYVVGLDIGSVKTSVLIAEIDEEQVKFLALGAAESKGLRKGLIVNLDSTVSSIRRAVEEAEGVANVPGGSRGDRRCRRARARRE